MSSTNPPGRGSSAPGSQDPTASTGSSSGASSSASSTSESLGSSGGLSGAMQDLQSRREARRAAGDSRRGTRADARAAASRSAAVAAARKGQPRRVKLTVSRIDPWSVMKMSFLLSVAIGIAMVVMTAILWTILNAMGVFTDIERTIQSLSSSTTESPFSIKDYVGFGRVVSLSVVIAVIDVILMTALATVTAFLYNICSSLVGGIQLTLTDD